MYDNRKPDIPSLLVASFVLRAGCSACRARVRARPPGRSRKHPCVFFDGSGHASQFRVREPGESSSLGHTCSLRRPCPQLSVLSFFTRTWQGGLARDRCLRHRFISWRRLSSLVYRYGRDLFSSCFRLASHERGV